METVHKILFQDSRNLSNIADGSIELIVTSPPYPMVEMWDEIFSIQNPQIKEALINKDGFSAFELMHQELDKVWRQIYRVLKIGGIACINIGDTARTIGGDFQLYNSHQRILSSCLKLGFQNLPNIIWRKQTNAPNKFMGSGMLPPGAYVTLEHEYILILRKGNRREFSKPEEKKNRSESAYFWEERNLWFSDLWEGLKGTRQNLNDKELRERSAAYPFELPYRLINMFSVKGDTVLDPFLGTGTTTLATISTQRNSIGVEIDPNFQNSITKKILNSKHHLNEIIKQRILDHIRFTENFQKTRGVLKYQNQYHKFPVMTKQEIEIKICQIQDISRTDNTEFSVSYQFSR